MPSYLRLLTEQPAHIANPPTGHTALYASSGTGGEHKYELYIKNPEGFSHPVGMFASGGTVSGNATFNSGVTVYSGGYTMSGGGDAAFVALVVNGTISGFTGPGSNAAGGGIIIQDNLTVSGSAAGVGGTISGTTQILVGSGHTNTSGTFSNAFGKAHNTSGLLSVAFGSANTSTGLGAFTSGRHNTASGVYSFAGGSANTSSGILSNSFGAGHLVSGDLSTAFGTGNTASAAASFAMGTGTTASGLGTFAAGSATTASGTSHFVIGRGNISSDLFVVGNGPSNTGVSGAYSNAFTVMSSGVTIMSSGATFESSKGSPYAALTIYSGNGQNALGFKLPRIDDVPGQAFKFDPQLSASTRENHDNRGLMFWDGRNIRVWTGGTYWATVALSGSCVYY